MIMIIIIINETNNGDSCEYIYERADVIVVYRKARVVKFEITCFRRIRFHCIGVTRAVTCRA